MLINGDARDSRLVTCIAAAPSFLLSSAEATAIAAAQVVAIRDSWDKVCAAAELTEVDKALLWRRQFLNAFAFENAPPALAVLAPG
jgi:serine/threonine-protein kinase HipA